MEYDIQQGLDTVKRLLKCIDNNLDKMNKVQVESTIDGIYHRFLFALDKNDYSPLMWEYIKLAKASWIIEHQ